MSYIKLYIMEHIGFLADTKRRRLWKKEELFGQLKYLF